MTATMAKCVAMLMLFCSTTSFGNSDVAGKCPGCAAEHDTEVLLQTKVKTVQSPMMDEDHIEEEEPKKEAEQLELDEDQEETMRMDDPLDSEDEESLIERNVVDLANINDDEDEEEETNSTESLLDEGKTRCDIESRIKDRMRAFFRSNGGTHRAPTFIRAAFHDAVDENNLAVPKPGSKHKRWEKAQWQHVYGSYGGLDGCLYNSLSHGTFDNPTGVPTPTHNWNLEKAMRRLGRFEKHARWNGLCDSVENCKVDILALGAITAIEMSGGPSITMEWGRQKGNCKKVVGAKGPFALREAPSLTNIHEPSHFREAFTSLGFDAREQTALMGAHTFGKVQPNICLGNFLFSHRGNFCNKREQLDPPVTDEMLVENGCTPKYGQVSKCWSEGIRENKWPKGGKVVYPMTVGSRERGRYTEPWGTKEMFGGTYWDRTPDKFDNDYFKVFSEEDYKGKDICCGKKFRGGCHAFGHPYNWTSKSQVDGGTNSACSMNWCRDDASDGKTLMKSTKAWAEVNHKFICTNRYCESKDGAIRRLVRLAGDWALLGDTDTLKAVKEFASDETKFFDAFTQAFTKVLRKRAPEVSLATCGGQKAPPKLAAPSPPPTPPPPATTPIPTAASTSTCWDKEPPQNWRFNTCEQLVAKGRCRKRWFKKYGLCNKSCGYCQAVSPTQPPPQAAPSFALGSVSSCPSGSTQVLTVAECRKAAEALSIPFGVEGTWGDNPHGCFEQAGKLYLDHSARGAAGGNEKLVCQAPTQPPALAATPAPTPKPQPALPDGWSVISSTKACEKNGDGVKRTSWKNRISLETCFEMCQNKSGCVAVDYYKSRWCNFFDAVCTSPRASHDGASSYKLATSATEQHEA